MQDEFDVELHCIHSDWSGVGICPRCRADKAEASLSSLQQERDQLRELLLSFRDRVLSVQGCENRMATPCRSCDGQLRIILKDLAALLHAAREQP